VNRQQLEHVIEEVGRRTGLEYFYIIGAAAVLAELPEPSEAALVQTRDVDIVPGTADANEEERIANQIDWVLGEGSEFEVEHQYYAQGLSRSTPQYAPSDWMQRARPVRVGAYTGLCMEIHDLALSKFGAGRPKDLEFNAALARTGLLSKDELLNRLEQVEADSNLRQRIIDRIGAVFR
jgi:hypothetical protein